ncbi:acyl transferase/acyl hydrolase/lysophospholipase [Whalleya microplaca]|nr:acyl transferase/acyl hydrolase/lysophospholipase [Whalleya microplaca]
MTESPSTPPNRHWVLSLDGGGVRGLSSLIILEEILNRAGKQPYEVFRLLCGASAGGISALMIGRIGMNIPECIGEFRDLSRQVFGRPRLLRTAWGLLRSRHDESIMVEKTKDLLERYSNAGGARMYEQPLNIARQRQVIPAYVVCLDAHPVAADIQTPSPLAVRLGTTPGIYHDASSCMVWDASAVRATSAAPTYFKPQKITVGHEVREFLDGGLHYNNPIETVSSVIETLNLGSPDIGYISIGTGTSAEEREHAKNYWRPVNYWAISQAVWWFGYVPKTPANSLRRYLHRTNQGLKDILGNAKAESAHVVFQNAVGTKTYFRFNCDETLDGYQLLMTALDKHEDMGKIENTTRQYLRRPEIHRLVTECANMLG